MSGVTGSLSGLFGLRYGGDGVPGRTGLDPLAGIKFFEEPENYFASGGGRSAYSSPPDLRGELAFGLDVFGQPAFEQIPGAVPESRADSPYEINLLDRNAADDPFTPAELEPILRPLDYDIQSLPGRLRDNLDLAAQGNARLVTTDSYDPPVPGISVPGELRSLFASANLANARNVAELLAARLSLSAVNVDAELTKLLSPDLALGCAWTSIGRWETAGTTTTTGSWMNRESQFSNTSGMLREARLRLAWPHSSATFPSSTPTVWRPEGGRWAYQTICWHGSSSPGTYTC